LPGDTFLTRQHTDNHAAIKHEGEERDRDPERRALEKSAGQQITEIPENQQTGPDVIASARSECPEHSPAERDDADGREEKLPTSRHEDNASENKEGNGIRDKMLEIRMQKRRSSDPDHSPKGPWVNPELIERALQHPIDDFHRPTDRDRAEEQAEMRAHRIPPLATAMV